MKIQFSLPTDEGFFSRYATLIPTLSKFSYLSQLISALTEFGVLYAIAYKRALDFLEPGRASLVAVSFAIIVTLLLEIGLRKFIPYSVRAILFKRFGGLDLAMSLSIFIITIGLLISSGVLSFKGSWDLVDYATSEPVEENTGAVDSSYTKAGAVALQGYSRDSLAIAQRYQIQIESKRSAVKSSIGAQEAQLRKYENREQATGQSYRSTKDRIRAQIAQLQAQGDEAIATLEAAKASELEERYREYKDKLSEAERTHKEGVAEVKQGNKDRLEERNSKVDRYGGSLGYFTLFCLAFLLLAVTLEEINKKGSGIEQIALPSQYSFSDSISNEFFNMLDEKYNYYTRSLIFKLASKTPYPPLPTAPPRLYDYGTVKQQRLRVEVEEPEGGVLRVKPREDNLPLSSPTLPTSREELEDEILATLQSAWILAQENFHKQAQELERTARGAMSVYLGDTASSSAVSDLEKKVYAYLNGVAPYPFKRPIGFKQDNTGNSSKQSNTSKQQKDSPQGSGEIQAETLSKQDKTQGPGTVYRDRTIVKEDSRTIAHKDRKTGEIKYYALPQVNNFIRKYEARVAEAQAKGDEALESSRRETLDYWRGRREELLNKQNGTGL